MRKIRLLGDPILRKKAKEVERIDDNIKSFIKELFEVMYQFDGVGLAAPQVGVSLRIFVMDDGLPRAFINPKIVYLSPEKVIDEEGCLSIPDVFENIERSKEVVVKYLDENGQEKEERFLDRSARIVQHEYDHLEGRLFIDLLSPERRLLLREKLLEIMKQSRAKSSRV